MGHKTLINGTQYTIRGGYALVNGVKRKIQRGKTLAQGTQKTITFTTPIPTDLTDTYWRWDNYITASTAERPPIFNINFKIKQSSASYDRFCFPFWDRLNNIYSYGWDYNSTYAEVGVNKSDGSWRTPYDQFFHISGGQSVKDASLIEILVKYATQCDSNWNPL